MEICSGLVGELLPRHHLPRFPAERRRRLIKEAIRREVTCNEFKFRPRLTWTFLSNSNSSLRKIRNFRFSLSHETVHCKFQQGRHYRHVQGYRICTSRCRLSHHPSNSLLLRQLYEIKYALLFLSLLFSFRLCLVPSFIQLAPFHPLMEDFFGIFDAMSLREPPKLSFSTLAPSKSTTLAASSYPSLRSRPAVCSIKGRKCIVNYGVWNSTLLLLYVHSLPVLPCCLLFSRHPNKNHPFNSGPRNFSMLGKFTGHLLQPPVSPLYLHRRAHFLVTSPREQSRPNDV